MSILWKHFQSMTSFGLNLFKMLVVDLLHEFELGVWKAVFSHLMRILYAAGASGCAVAELDQRFVIVLSYHL